MEFAPTMHAVDSATVRSTALAQIAPLKVVLRPTGLAEFRNLLESAKDALDAAR